MDWIIVGLGNPGKAYANHRHNAGFWALDQLHKHWMATPWILKNKAMVSTAIVHDQKITLCCPQTFMNLSGQALSPLVKQNPKAHILVIHDELDLPCGQWRIKNGGSARGHNGLKSIHTILGPDYARIRVGIDRPANQGTVSDYVLHAPIPSDRDKILNALDQLPKIIDGLISGQENLPKIL
jgi:PTH1 family peptidyl-tRNA hydrolase